MSKYADLYPQLKVLNEQEAFKCGSCLEICEIKAGIFVTECLHTICKACITTRFDNAIDGVITCPFIDGKESCKMVLLPCTMKECFDVVDYFMELCTYLAAHDKAAEEAACGGDQTPPVQGPQAPPNGCDPLACLHCTRINAMLCKVLQNPLLIDCVLCITRKQNGPNQHTEVHVQKSRFLKPTMRCPTCREVVVNLHDADFLDCPSCEVPIDWRR